MRVICALCTEVVFDEPLVRRDRARNVIAEIDDADGNVTSYISNGAFYYEIRDRLGVGIIAGVHNHS